jgi:hypothetical protein
MMAPGEYPTTTCNNISDEWIPTSTASNNFITKTDIEAIEEMYKEAQRKEKINLEKKDHEMNQIQCHLKSRQIVSRLPVKFKKPHMNRRII